MKHALVFAMIVAATAGCGKKKDDAGSAKPNAAPTAPGPTTPTAPPAPAAPPPLYTGPLTVERILAAKDVIPRGAGNAAWADGLARLEGQLGKATKVDGNRYQWAVVSGDDCAYFYVEKDDGAKYGGSGEIVGAMMTPMKVAKDGPSGNRAECLKITGVDGGPPEDPAAAPPPADGSAVTADVFRTTALAGRSKWKDQVVKVTGIVAGVSTSTSGADSWTTVTLKASEDDKDKAVSCSHDKNVAATVKLGDHAIATGTVKITEWTSMGSGDTTLEPTLSLCTAVVAPPAKGKGK